MNLFIGTGKIMSNPRLCRIKQKVFLKINIILFNKKKKMYLYSIICFIKGKLGIHLFDILKKNDIVIIEGYIKIKFEKIYHNNKSVKMVTIQAKKVYNLKRLVF
uniref:hypothetical protein n=1 Tax=Hypnea wynnei TaxID=1867777 RepID=UPI0027DA89C1|nr:hypothetical protein REP92_pgp119 [Hypnea wynnei]WCH56508.1 hypothetical protein [Hypnea wynnei]